MQKRQSNKMSIIKRKNKISFKILMHLRRDLSQINALVMQVFQRYLNKELLR